MKKILMAMIATGLMAFAGGDIAPIEEVKSVEVVKANKAFYVGASGTANQLFAYGERDWLSTSNINKTNYGLGLDAGYVVYGNSGIALALEGRYNYTATDFEEDVHTYSVFAKPSYDFEYAKVYGLAGYSYVDFGNDFNADGFAYGGGFAKNVYENVEVFAEYVVNPTYETENFEVENETIAVGVNYYF